MKRSLLSIISLYYLMGQHQNQVDAYIVWWNPLTWLDEALVLTFKLIVKALTPNKNFASNLKKNIE